MEQVFPPEMGLPSASSRLDSTKNGLGAGRATHDGVVEKVLESGHYRVVMDDGHSMEVKSLETLKLGSRVRVYFPTELSPGPQTHAGPEGPAQGSADGLQWFAFIPLAFGGNNAMAKLEVFVERQKEGSAARGDVATYFIFTVLTDETGEVQWSIYLKGRQVTLQVFSKLPRGKEDGLNKMLTEVEASLKKRGFVMTMPAVRLTRPFKVPAGFRLNVQG